MKIDEVRKIESYEIEVSDDEHQYYIRYSSKSWYVRIGESEEPVLDDDKVEKLEIEFQKFLKLKKI